MEASVDWNAIPPIAATVQVAGVSQDPSEFDGGAKFAIVEHHKVANGKKYDWNNSYLIIAQGGHSYRMLPTEFVIKRAPHAQYSEIGEELGLNKGAVIGRMNRGKFEKPVMKEVIARDTRPPRQASTQEDKPAQAKPAKTVRFSLERYLILQRFGMKEGVLKTDEVVSLYETIESHRKQALQALCTHPFALQKIAEWYAVKEGQSEAEALAIFAKEIWAKEKSVFELRAEVAQSERIKTGESGEKTEEPGEDAEEAPEPKTQHISKQPDFIDRWHTIGSESLRLQAIIAKNYGPGYEESRTDLVDSILQLRPYDRLLRELVSQLEKKSPDLQAQRAFWLARNALGIMAGATETLRQHNQLLVAKIARSRSSYDDDARYGLGFEELMADGNVGLMTAIELFNYRRGTTLGTYAGWWIRCTINRALSERARTIRLPSNIAVRLGKFRRAQYFLCAKLGCNPTAEQLAEKTKWPLEFVMKMQTAADLSYTASLNMPVGEAEKDRDTVLDLRKDDAAIDSNTVVFKSQFRSTFTRAMLQVLTPREERVMRLRHGIHPNRPHTEEETAKGWGCRAE